VRFSGRADAGRQLAAELGFLHGSDGVVLGLPRGGVPVAFEVAAGLGAPLDVIVVRKLGLPVQPELAMGAIGEGGITITNDAVVRRASVTDEELAAAERRERQELERQARRFRAGRPRVDIADRTAVVVDDGIATGSTARAACQVARAQGAARVIMAAPVGAAASVAALRDSCDEVRCLQAPVWFSSVGEWYADFTPVPDAEVTRLLQQAAHGGPAAGGRDQAGDPPPDRAP
jgi:putative phosphoribosyl transferase